MAALVLLAVGLAGAGGCKRAEDHTVAVPRAGAAQGYNVLLVTLDTTRADRLGCYGATHTDTPNLDALADDGVLFEQAVTSATSTLPSHATIMTGLNTLHHGAHENGKSSLHPRHVTLAERLRQAGYATAAFVSTFVLDARYGLDQGFDQYEFAVGSGLRGPAESIVHERRADDTTRSALEWLGDRPADQPYFLWVHYFDPHYTYDSPLAALPKFAGRPYEAEIAFVDAELGKLLTALAARGDHRRTLIVVTSDHGEGLGDHGESFHGVFLYESTLRAVLVFSCPTLFAKPVRVQDRLAGTVDIVPTVLNLVGLPAEGTLDGIDLLTAPAPADRAIYIETFFSRTVGCRELFGLRRLHDKFILAPRPEYYDLRQDPHETRNLYASGAARALEARLARMLEKTNPHASTDREMSAEERARLAALGYVAGAGLAPDEELPDPKDHIEIVSATSKIGHLIGAGDFAEALPLARELVGQCGGYDLPVRQLVRCLEALDRRAEAAAALRAFVADYPSVDILIFAARRFHTWGDDDQAAGALAGAEALDPRCGMAEKLRGDWAFAANRFSQAADHYARALKRDPQRMGPGVRKRLNEARKRIPAAGEGSAGQP
jgi:choline-sulfatase